VTDPPSTGASVRLPSCLTIIKQCDAVHVADQHRPRQQVGEKAEAADPAEEADRPTAIARTAAALAKLVRWPAATTLTAAAVIRAVLAVQDMRPPSPWPADHHEATTCRNGEESTTHERNAGERATTLGGRLLAQPTLDLMSSLTVRGRRGSAPTSQPSLCPPPEGSCSGPGVSHPRCPRTVAVIVGYTRDRLPHAGQSAEARQRFILDHDPGAAAQSDGPQLTATNQPPHERSR
jgi:hypothetical protein